MINLSKEKSAAVPIAFCPKHHHTQWHWMYQLQNWWKGIFHPVGLASRVHHHRMTWIVSRIQRKIICYRKSKWSWGLSDKHWMQVTDRNPSLLFRVLACLQLSTSGECFLLSDVIPDLPEGLLPSASSTAGSGLWQTQNTVLGNWSVRSVLFLHFLTSSCLCADIVRELC